MPIHVIAIAPWMVRTEARFVLPLIERACSRGCETPPEKLIEDAATERAVFWLITRGKEVLGICFTRLTRLDSGELAVWVTVSGGYQGALWAKALRKRLKQFMAAEKADLMVWAGRKGWARWFNLTPLGMTPEGLWTFEDR